MDNGVGPEDSGSTEAGNGGTDDSANTVDTQSTDSSADPVCQPDLCIELAGQ